MSTRREAMGAMMAAGIGLPLSGVDAQIGVQGTDRERARNAPRWSPGIEGQRKADLGNGTYLNPIMAGAYSDPSILRDGTDYYMTFSSFEADPGLLIWHSTDLVNWRPVTSVLPSPLGSVFAVDLVKHDGRFFIYIPMVPTAWSNLKENRIFVIHSDRIDGGWSRPIDLGIRGRIDPGHAVGEDGRRYLFLSGGYRVRLSADGLSADGAVEKVYDGWKYPDDWITEAYALEGPKITRRGDYFYLVSAVGGTGGPPTGHMVIVARSRSINGPWVDCPHNPIVRTTDAGQAWWSRGHATMVEGPAGDWWMVYHGYENGFRTLGRQTLLQPVTWDKDGWPVPQGGDLGRPIAKPRGGSAGPHGIARSDDFRRLALGTRWTFHAPKSGEAGRVSVRDGNLILRGLGKGPEDSAPLTNLAGDRSYRVSVQVNLDDAATGGLLLFLSSRLFLGIAIDGERLVTYAGGRMHYWREPAPASRAMYLRIENREHIITFYYSIDGIEWQRHGLRLESSGYNANTLLPGEGESLRPAIFSSGTGSVRFRDYRYEAL
ncbi:family 43 glycosylhydrolase [Sphingomonas sp. Leaf10]|uniref:family 43 glycosylhydrolase n=1 Tax=Sphingomonas sp. Leaf10 TaxID=1735676 RepID=UPI0009E8F9B5|nr:family 43 glycosylhydrolase [Sphingomonas sp. Leaf10]